MSSYRIALKLSLLFMVMTATSCWLRLSFTDLPDRSLYYKMFASAITGAVIIKVLLDRDSTK